jgi:hypothetical protein
MAQLLLEQNEATAARRRWFFACVDDTDGKTPETGLSFSGAELQISKNGAAFASFGGSATELSDGLYYYEATAAELDTLGLLVFKVEKSGVRLSTSQPACVVEWDPYAVSMGWPTVLEQSSATAAQRRFEFVCVDDTDGYTSEPGLAFSAGELQISKNGAALANTAGTVTDRGDGVYVYEATADELDTLGALALKVEKSGVRLALYQAAQVGVTFAQVDDGISYPVLANATTASEIRDRIYAVIEGLVPDMLGGDLFRRYRNELDADFRAWCTANAAGAFRRFQVRDTGRRELPDNSETGYEFHVVTFEILVAYPQTHRYGSDNAMDRDDVAYDDARLINAAVGWAAKPNFTFSAGPPAIPDATPLGAFERDRQSVRGVDLLVVEARFRYIRNVQG